MIKLETAIALRDAGLEWDLQNGDIYFADEKPCLYYGPITSVCGAIDNKWVFAPRLDQILNEIERRGYVWDLYQTNAWEDEYRNYNIHLRLIGHSIESDVNWYGLKTPTEAAALALLFVLKEGE